MRKQQWMLDQSLDSVAILYNTLHGTHLADTVVRKVVFQPNVPNIQWAKFNDFCRYWQEKRFVVLSGVTGSGMTNLATRSARLLAGKPETNLLELQCAPQFDLELHRKYIGYEDDRGQFHAGKLLEMWDACTQRPNERFVALIDNFDKINPETFFGPELWEALSSSNPAITLGGRRVRLPKNFYLLSVTHLGPGARLEFNEEHFRRLGAQYILQPNAVELIGHLQRQKAKLLAQTELDEVSKTQLRWLSDTNNLHRFLYYFLKTNALIEKRYARGYQLGQASNVRQFYCPSDTGKLKAIFISHINALNPSVKMEHSDFDDLDYTVANGGVEPHSNFLARQIQFLYRTGYFVEITMVAATALLTFLVGWWVFRRRERLIRRYGERAQGIFQSFEDQEITAETASKQLQSIKQEVDDLVLRRQLNYTEGLYFLAFIDDRVKRIDYARSVSEHFTDLFNTFMEDGVLTENEYLKLRQFLQSIRHRMQPDLYERFLEKVEEAYSG